MGQVGIHDWGTGTSGVIYSQDDWVTPEMFGTVDGVADNVQIQAAIDSGRKVKCTYGAIYVTAAPITITHSDSYFDMNGAEIHTVADIDGIHIGAQGAGGTIVRLHIKDLYVHKTAGVPTKAGVLISQVQESDISIAWSQGFHTSVKLEADTSGCALNKIWLGTLIPTKRCLDLYPSGTGWVNANTIYKGFYSGGAIDYCIITAAGGANKTTGNSFIAPYFEPTSAIYAVEEAGQYNTYYEPQTDGVPVWSADGKVIHFAAASFYSAVFSNTPLITYTDAGAGSYPLAQWNVLHLRCLNTMALKAQAGWNDRIYNLQGSGDTLAGGYGALFNGDAWANFFIGLNSTNYLVKMDGTGLSIRTGDTFKVEDVSVVGARVIDARCDDAVNSGDATTDGVIDSLRDAMIAHGLIAAA
jgi:hypothetical protein